MAEKLLNRIRHCKKIWVVALCDFQIGLVARAGCPNPVHALEEGPDGLFSLKEREARESFASWLARTPCFSTWLTENISEIHLCKFFCSNRTRPFSYLQLAAVGSVRFSTQNIVNVFALYIYIILCYINTLTAWCFRPLHAGNILWICICIYIYIYVYIASAKKFSTYGLLLGRAHLHVPCAHLKIRYSGFAIHICD